MRLLCLDVGSRRIGVAISDPEEILATPLAVIEHKDDNVTSEAIRSLIEEYGVDRVVAGMPYSLDGSRGPQARDVEAFLGHLSGQISVPIETWDERFSTTTAQQMMEDAGTKKSRRKENLDALAAAVILQGYLDCRAKDR